MLPLYNLYGIIGGGSRGGHGVRSNPFSEPPPRPPRFNILGKRNNLASFRPNYFLFVGYLKKWDKFSKANPNPFIHVKPHSRNPSCAPGHTYMAFSTLQVSRHRFCYTRVCITSSCYKFARIWQFSQASHKLSRPRPDTAPLIPKLGLQCMFLLSYENSMVQLFHTFLCNSQNYHPEVLWMTRWHCCTRPKTEGKSASGHAQHRGCDNFDCCAERYEMVVL